MTARRPRALGDGHRARGARRAGDGDEVVLRLPERVRRRAEHEHLPRLPRAAGSLPVLNERAVELAARVGLALQCDVRPSVFARKNYFYPDMPKDYQVTQYDRPINVAGRLDLPSGLARRDHAGAPRGGHRQVDPRRRRAAASTAPSTASSTTTGPASRCSRSCPSPTSAPPTRPASTWPSCAAVLLAVGASDAKMEEGSMRVDANVSVRRGRRRAVRHAVRDQEPQLAAVARPGHRVRGAAARSTSSRPARRSCRRRATGTRTAGRTRPGRRKEEAEDYRYFPEPDLVPRRARAPRGSTRCGRALPPLPADRRGAAGRGRRRRRRPTRPSRCSCSATRTASRSPPSPPAASRRGCSPTSSTTCRPRRPGRSTPAPSPASWPWRRRGRSPPPRRRRCCASIAERGGTADAAAVAAELGFEAMDTRRARAPRRRGHRRQRRRRGRRSLAGNDKAAGAITGHVMKATQGQGRRQGHRRAARRPQGRRRLTVRTRACESTRR